MQGLIKYTFILLVFLPLSLRGQSTYFTEVSSEIGLNYIYPGNDFQMAGGGLMVIDVNNDGWEDFFQAGGVFDSKLWINKGGTFIDGTESLGLNVLRGFFVQGAVCADYNNDGYQDFFIANYGKGMGRGDKMSPVILKNVKGEKFEIVKLEDVLEPGDYSSACWGDFNKDGFPDLYIANYLATMGGIQDENGKEIGYNPTCFENKLLLNQNGSGFVECAEEYGLNDGGCGLAASFTDVDNDGDADLLLLNDFGEWTGIGNKYYRNDYPEKKFTDISVEAGFDKLMYGMGIGQGDYDADADLDYYITNIGPNSLYNNENGILNDVAHDYSLDIPYVYDSVRGTSWSGLFFDMEFDGDLDLYVSKGNVAALVPRTAISDGNKMFLHEDGSFEDISIKSGTSDILSHRGSIIFDYDHDGDLDIISSVVKLPWSAFAKKEQKLKVYRNDLNAGNWIGIKLVGSDGVNRDCFGCNVVFKQDSVQMIKEVDGGSGQASQSTRIIYFGLLDDKKMQSATIDWGNGDQLILENLKANFVYEVSMDGSVIKLK